MELAHACLGRLRTIGKTLNCIATLEDDSILAEAERLDRERASGKLRGPLHGVPLAPRISSIAKAKWCSSGRSFAGVR